MNGALEHFIRPGIALAVVASREGGPGGVCGDCNARGGGGSSGGAGARFSEQLIQPSCPLVCGGCHDQKAAEALAWVGTALTLGHRYAIFAER